MLSPNGLVRVKTELDLDEPVLLHSLSGFLDAGSAGRIAVEHLLTELPHSTVAEFDLDAMYDYRARRPRMTFLTDHYGDIEMPRLVVDLVTDLADRPFLLLHGPEPDFRWAAFADDVVWLSRLWDTSLVLGMHAVPWPAPHTRPVNVTAHSSDPDLLAGRRPFVGDLEVPGHVAGLIEITTTDNDVASMGFAAHVPHYLSGSEFPRAAVALLESVSDQTGLRFPLATLSARADEAEEQIAAQVSSEAENLEAVRLLEQQYDEFMARYEGIAADLEDANPEEFVSEVERFLADQDRRGDTW
jgi:hypothetical protein